MWLSTVLVHGQFSYPHTSLSSSSREITLRGFLIRNARSLTSLLVRVTGRPLRRISIVDKHPLTPPNSNVSVALEFVSPAFAASSGKQTLLVSVRSVTDFFGSSFFCVASSSTSGFGTSTITGKKRDRLRKTSGMPEAGTVARFSSRKRIAFALGAGLGQIEFSDGAPFVETALPTESVRDRCLTGLLRTIPASLARARASCAFTVPWGTPKTSAASFVVKPSISRNWNVLRSLGESCLTPSTS